MKAKTFLRKSVSGICDIIIWSFVIVILYGILSVFFFSSFKISSGSMMPAIMPGDNILVFKPTVGARLFDVFDSLNGEYVHISRLPGCRSIRRNDVIVFNIPYPNSSEKIEMHILKYFAKRCVALPGDTFYIANGYYFVKGCEMSLGDTVAQKNVEKWERDKIPLEIYNCLYSDSTESWNIKNFGPYYIPKAETTIKMNRKNYLLYHKLIEWEQKKETTFRNDTVFLNDEPVFEYCFLKNYYFATGDYAEDSQDSRYWGVLPEEYIVGVAWMIWYSSNMETGETRWKRCMKIIH